MSFFLGILLEKCIFKKMVRLKTGDFYFEKNIITIYGEK